MTQSTLFAPTRHPIKAKPLDPYLAQDFDDFLSLFVASSKRLPTGPEMLSYYEGHQEQYKEKFHEPWAALEGRRRKLRGVVPKKVN